MSFTIEATPLGVAGIDRVRDYILSLKDPAAWDAVDLEERKATWDLALTPEESATLAGIVDEATAKFGLWSENKGTTEEWRALAAPLDDYFERVQNSLEGGVGVARIRNLPIRPTNADVEYNENMLWLVGARLGQAVNQMGGGKLLARLQDLRDPHRGRDTRPENTNEPLKHHTDGSDLLLLLCVRQALVGGNSFISSSVRTVKSIAQSHPELLESLLTDYFPFDRNEEQPEGEAPFYLTRLVTIVDGKISVRYSRELINTALQAPGAPQLTERQERLLDLLDQTNEEGGTEVDFSPGDLMIINNYSVLHGRSIFTDSDDLDTRRLLMRLWIVMAKGRPLPFDFDRGVNHDGVGRGAVPLKQPA